MYLDQNEQTMFGAYRPAHGFQQMSENHEGAAHVPEECHE
jgi:hypothetical protein